jgi:hypothetical protein
MVLLIVCVRFFRAERGKTAHNEDEYRYSAGALL